MSTPKINGSVQPQLKSITIKFDPSNGTVTRKEWACAGKTGLASLAEQYKAAGASYDLTLSGTTSSLVTTETHNPFQGDDDAGQVRWELFANQLQIDIKNHPNWGGLSIDDRAAILKDVEKHKDGKTITGERPWGEVGDLSTADHFFQHMIRDKNHFLKPQWVIRVTENVPNTYQLFTEADGGVGTIYTTSQLGLPSGRLRSTVQSITEPVANDYLIYGWLKVSYTEITGANQRVDVSNELWLDQYPSILY